MDRQKFDKDKFEKKAIGHGDMDKVLMHTVSPNEPEAITEAISNCLHKYAVMKKKCL